MVCDAIRRGAVTVLLMARVVVMVKRRKKGMSAVRKTKCEVLDSMRWRTKRSQKVERAGSGNASACNLSKKKKKGQEC